MIEPQQIATINEEVIKLLNLDIEKPTDIYIGYTNVAHMSINHPEDYTRYFSRLSKIINEADYVRLKKDDNSIEYIKSFGKYVKVAVRVAGDGKYYARSLYRVHDKTVKRMLKNGELFLLTKT